MLLGMAGDTGILSPPVISLIVPKPSKKPPGDAAFPLNSSLLCKEPIAMKEERTVREATYRPSPTSPPCVVLIDPDPLSPKRYSHNARWTWNEEEGMFFASLVIETHMRAMTDPALMAEMAATLTYLHRNLDLDGGTRQSIGQKKRLTPQRKRK